MLTLNNITITSITPINTSDYLLEDQFNGWLVQLEVDGKEHQITCHAVNPFEVEYLSPEVELDDMTLLNRRIDHLRSIAAL